MTTTYTELIRREMTRGAFAHLEAIPTEGYRWIDAAPIPNRRDYQGRYLVGPTPRTISYSFKPSSAFRKRGRESKSLHRAFAGLIPDESNILGFASKHGCLGVGTNVRETSGDSWAGPKPPLHSVKDGSPMWYGESFESWTHEIASMKSLLKIWTMVKARDETGLSRHVSWYEHGVRISLPPDNFGMEIIADERTGGASTLSQWSRGETVAPAHQFLLDHLEDRLRGHINVKFITDPDTRSTRIWHVPDSLLSALYVLFALEVSEAQVEFTCDYCGESSLKRKGQKFCCPSHKQLAYVDRKRKEGAK